MENYTLNGINILITGGNKGIGLAISEQLIALGANIVSLSRSISNNNLIENEKYQQIQCDITNFDSLKSTFLELKSKYKNFDILINNAGIIDFKPFVESDIHYQHKIIATNMTAAIDITYLVLAQMLENQRGLIVNMSSVATKYNYANCSIYNASKSGLLSFSRSLRSEVRTKGIKIIDILPGPTNTEIWDAETLGRHSELMISTEKLAEIVSNSILQSYFNNFMIEEIVITPQFGSI